MLLPATREEMSVLGWEALDIILVTGDAYIDCSSVGVAVVGTLLVDQGFRVGIIAQPDIQGPDAITRLGEPRLFWGVTGGCVDSMVANFTAAGKRRRRDDFTPGGRNQRRPDRAVIVYSNLIRHYFKGTVPIVLGGMEASLRRLPHYDFWSNRVRRSILVDAKADFLLYGMADRSVVELARALKSGTDPRQLRGLCYMAGRPPEEYRRLPPYDRVAQDPAAFTEMFGALYANSDPLTAHGLAQQQDSRFLVHNPPALPLTSEELDAVYGLEYSRQLHPHDAMGGAVRALETIRFSITTHRGCYGECNFCAIAVHQGRTVVSRTADAIVAEAETISRHPDFKGYIHDVGGATANMYGIECRRKERRGACPHKRCLFPQVCRHLPVDHGAQRRLLARLRALAGVKQVKVASGVRYDMVLADAENGSGYLRELAAWHVAGQLKVAPEHVEREVLRLMGKPGSDLLLAFKQRFEELSRAAGKKQFLTYYFLAAHPGCDLAAMRQCREFVRRSLGVTPRQAQIFTPTPSTWSTLMYWTGVDPFSGGKLFVERGQRGKEEQKGVLLGTAAGKGRRQPGRREKRRRSRCR